MASFSTSSPKKGQFQSPIVRHKSASPWRITRFSPYLPRNPLIPGFSNLGIGSSIPNPLYQASSSAEQNNPPQRPESVVRLVLPFSLLEKVFIPTHHHQDYRYLGSQYPASHQGNSGCLTSHNKRSPARKEVRRQKESDNKRGLTTK